MHSKIRIIIKKKAFFVFGEKIERVLYFVSKKEKKMKEKKDPKSKKEREISQKWCKNKKKIATLDI